MDNTTPTVDATAADTAKAFVDLEGLVTALLSSLPRAKPWQRQLRDHLQEVERHLQILRMTIAMDRPHQEVADSTSELRKALRVAQHYLAAGRADAGTKAAVGIACELGQKLVTLLKLERPLAAG